MTTLSSPLSMPERRAIFGLAVVSGLLLLALHEAVAAGWLQSLTWRLPAYAVAIGAPLAMILGVDSLPRRDVCLVGAAFAAVLALTGLHFGWQAEGGPGTHWGGVAAYAALATLGGFVALPLAQVFAERGEPRLPYARLYFRTWRNALLLLLTALFCALVWLLLALWAQLFELIDIALFTDLFTHRRLAYPLTGVAAGIGLTLFSGLTRVIAVNRRLVVAAARELAPFLACVTLLFLASLALFGAQALWDSGIAASLLLALTIVQIAFIGVIYDDGNCTPPYPHWLRGFVHLALLVTPVHPLLAMRAIALRVEQYGWTNDRIYAMAAAVVLLLYALGYAISVWRRSPTQWLPWIAPVNTTMGVVVVATCVLLASPLLDPHRISVADQVGRLLAGETTRAGFDFRYLRFEGGRPGRAALQRLAEIEGHPQAESIRSASARALELPPRWAGSPAAAGVDVRDWIDTGRLAAPVPEAFWSYLQERAGRDPERRCFRDPRRPCTLLAVDLDGRGERELVLVQPECTQPAGLVYRGDATYGWARAGELVGGRDCRVAGPTSGRRHDRLEAGDIGTVPARWRRLRIGGETFAVRE